MLRAEAVLTDAAAQARDIVLGAEAVPQNASEWLLGAHFGSCSTSNGQAGSCHAGDFGEFKLASAVFDGSWTTLIDACLTKCASCSRCRSIQVSLHRQDCIWFHQCDVKALSQVSAGRLSGPTTHAARRTPRSPQPAVWVDVPDEPPPDRWKGPIRDVPPPRASLWLAMGVITAPGFEPSSSRTLLRHQSLASRGEGSPIVWQYVSTDARYLRDARFTLVPCRDGPRWDKQAVCVCKTHYWFLSALKLFPNARFIGKMEDDTIVHDARLVAELQHAYGRRPHSDLIWYSFFMWAGSSLKERYGAWCGDGDKYLLGSSESHMLRHGCTPSPRRAGEGRAHQNYTVERIQREIQGNTSAGFRRIEIDLAAPPDDDEGLEIAPFATGAIDVRSRKLAENLGNCRHAWKFVQEAWAGGHANEDCPRTADLCSHDSTGTSCDGFQGYLIAKCHDWDTAVTAEHLTWTKFEPTIRADGLSLHTSVTHGKKSNGDGMKGRRLPYKWVYSMATAMLPLPYELFRTPHGVGWKPLDMNASLEYVQLMRQRDTKRVRHAGLLSCSEMRRDGHHLPCGRAWSGSPTASAATPSAEALQTREVETPTGAWKQHKKYCWDGK